MANSRAIIVHTLHDVLAALEAATELKTPVVLQSAPDAIFYAGSLYLLTMFRQGCEAFPKAQAIFILDSADASAEAVAAMQMGHKHLISTAPPELRVRLADIAAQLGVAMVEQNDTLLDLRHAHDAKAACKEYLTAAI